MANELNITKGSLDELKAKMNKGIVDFAFLKKDGTIRCAKGTLVSEYFNYIPQGEPRKNDSVVTYFDIEKNCFRSFVKDNFLGFI